ncbi:MAG: glycosyltransferase [Candidatus Eremiobacterota bacterium]
MQQIARFHNVWVITRENNRASIEKKLSKNPIVNTHWIYYDLPSWARFWKRGGQGIQIYYYLWQTSIYFIAKRLHKEINFDLCHHITFGVYWRPSFLILLPIPFIWGPLGGGEATPLSFYKTFSYYGIFYEVLRYIARWIGEKDPFVKLNIKKASLTLCKARETYNRLKILGIKNIMLYSEAGISQSELYELGEFKITNTTPFRVISSGRLLCWKGFHLALLAFKIFNLHYPDSEYWITGDGHERKNLEKLAYRLNIIHKVYFCGKISRQEVLKNLSECDILLHPSLHDSGGWVCLEAMAAGRPVICLDLGGTAIQITKETGFKIPAITPEQAINDMAEAMLKLATNPELRIKMGEAGKKRVEEHFNWDKKGEWINDIYWNIVNSCPISTV